jgi:hypothetical protein
LLSGDVWRAKWSTVASILLRVGSLALASSGTDVRGEHKGAVR